MWPKMILFRPHPEIKILSTVAIFSYRLLNMEKCYEIRNCKNVETNIGQMMHIMINKITYFVNQIIGGKFWTMLVCTTQRCLFTTTTWSSSSTSTIPSSTMSIPISSSGNKYLIISRKPKFNVKINTSKSSRLSTGIQMENLESPLWSSCSSKSRRVKNRLIGKSGIQRNKRSRRTKPRIDGFY